MDSVWQRASEFVQREARLLDRHVFAACFLGGPPEAVVAALQGYRNEDGGFGHGLEPDKRCPASLPIDVEVALQTLVDAGAGAAAGAAELIRDACDFLAGAAAAAGEGGAVPLAFPVIDSFPRAAHWTEWTYEPGINPTAGLAGHLYELSVEHPWREEAAAWCWAEIEAGRVPGDGHSMLEALRFLEAVPEVERAGRLAAGLVDRLATASMFRLDPAEPGYGLTPLHVAPSPASRWRQLVGDDVIEGHLTSLLESQQDDGGWEISWEPPSMASRLEWRGSETVRALQVLVAYGQVSLAVGGA